MNKQRSYPIHIHSPGDVERLDQLLRSGWWLDPNAEGSIMFPADMSAETMALARGKNKDVATAPLLLLLTEGRRESAQRALALMHDRNGRVDTSLMRLSRMTEDLWGGRWRLCTMLLLGREWACCIFDEQRAL